MRRYSDRIPPYPETQSYVKAVLARYVELGGVVIRRDGQDSAAKKFWSTSQGEKPPQTDYGWGLAFRRYLAASFIVGAADVSRP